MYLVPGHWVAGMVVLCGAWCQATGWVGTVAIGPEIVDFGYPKYQYFGAFGILKM